MTLGTKLSKLRRENNYTQEQLADLLGVSRQAISKWESDVAFPETEKLIRLSDMYGCSLDYLLRDEIEKDYVACGAGEEKSTYTVGEEKLSYTAGQKNLSDERNQENFIRYDSVADGNILIRRKPFMEKKSERTLWGMPLWHIGKNAKGVFACGLKARGIFSIGLLSTGIFSFGVLSFGGLALGSFAFGLLAIGSVAVGVISIGAVSIGIVAMGALAVGDFSAGAAAIGRYVAIGDEARGAIAIGNSKAVGSVFQKVGELTVHERENVKCLIDANVPGYLGWAKEIIKLFL